MTKTIHSLLPDADALLALEPEELAGYLIEHLNSLPDKELAQLNRYNFSLGTPAQDYPQESRKNVISALMEAWIWLEREGLIAPKPAATGEWVFITRRGRKLKNHVDVENYRKSSLLPRGLLHPSIAEKVWATFLRGDYDTAVFQAFKEVEVAVRSAGGYSKDDYGTDLMRKAFKPETGPLADKNAVKSEQEAESNLFAGAIGLYKNPSSHRYFVDDSARAVEMITLASHLLGIVDSRQNQDSADTC